MRTYILGLSLSLAFASLALARTTPVGECVEHSGAEAARCLESFLAGGSAEPAFTDAAVRDHCSEDVTYAMGGLGVDDLVLVLRNACTDFGHDWITVTRSKFKGYNAAGNRDEAAAGRGPLDPRVQFCPKTAPKQRL